MRAVIVCSLLCLWSCGDRRNDARSSPAQPEVPVGALPDAAAAIARDASASSRLDAAALDAPGLTSPERPAGPVRACLAPGARTSSAHATAERVMRFFWGELDGDLLLLVETGRLPLATSDDMSRFLDRVLLDPRSDAWLRPVVATWLDLPEAPPATHGLTPALWADMREEVFRFARETLIVGDGLSSIPSFFAGDFTFVNTALAQHYGFPAPVAPWAKTPVGPERGGILSLGALLAARVNAPTRGHFVIDRFTFCGALLPPPPTDHPARTGRTVPRASLEVAAQPSSSCGACHNVFDRAGWGQQRFDELGRLRLREPDGTPIDERGTYNSDLSGPTAFSGYRELATRLAQERTPRLCVAAAVYRQLQSARAPLVGTDDPRCGPAFLAIAGEPDFRAVLRIFGAALGYEAVR